MIETIDDIDQKILDEVQALNTFNENDHNDDDFIVQPSIGPQTKYKFDVPFKSVYKASNSSSSDDKEMSNFGQTANEEGNDELFTENIREVDDLNEGDNIFLKVKQHVSKLTHKIRWVLFKIKRTFVGTNNIYADDYNYEDFIKRNNGPIINLLNNALINLTTLFSRNNSSIANQLMKIINDQLFYIHWLGMKVTANKNESTNKNETHQNYILANAIANTLSELTYNVNKNSLKQALRVGILNETYFLNLSQENRSCLTKLMMNIRQELSSFNETCTHVEELSTFTDGDKLYNNIEKTRKEIDSLLIKARTD